MLDIILIFVAISMLVSVYIEYIGGVKLKKGIILAVSLPYGKDKEKEVLEIVQNYKKELNKVMILIGIFFLPIIMLSKVSLVFIYFVIWTMVLFKGSSNILEKYSDKMKDLKRRNNWFVGTTNIRNIDTEVSKLRNEMVVSKWWFIPSILIALINIAVAYNINKSLLLISTIGLLGAVVFIGVYIFYGNKSTESYTDDSSINIAYNMVYKKYWTMGCVVAATIQSLTNLLMFIFIKNVENSNIVFLPIGIAPMIFLIGIYLITTKVTKSQEELLSKYKESIEVDSDDYWKGDVYNNPHDPRSTVEKRVGVGVTYNMGNKKGRGIVFGIYTFTFLVLLFVFIMVCRFDFVKMDIIVNTTNIEIKVPTYGSTVEKVDIEEIKLIDNIEVKFKTNGAATEEYAIGYFDVKDYGNALLYVYSKEGPYVEIKYKDGYMFIAGESKEETEKYYNELIK